MPSTIAPPAKPNAADAADAARAELSASVAAKAAGQHRQGAAAAQRACEQAEAAGDDALKGTALRLLCLHQWRLGDAEAAVVAAQRALPLLQSEADAAGRAEVLCTIAMAYNDLGMHSDALAQVMLSLEAARAAGSKSLTSWSLNRIGITYEHLAEFDEAERFLAEALEIARLLEDGDEEKFSALNNLCSLLLVRAQVSLDAGRRAEAQAFVERAKACGHEALALAEASGNTHRQAICHGNLSTVFTRLGEHAQALKHIDVSRRLAQAGGYRPLVLTSTIDRAHVLRHQGDVAGAIALYSAGLRDVEPGDHGTAVHLHRDLYECHKAVGDVARALHHHEQLLEMERAQMKQRADIRTRLLLNRLDMELVRTEAERARLDAEVQRLRARQLESEMQQLAAQAQELGRRALEDQLTGLANRRRVDEELPRQLAQAHERTGPMCIAAIDLDHFKVVNDRHGHAAGDDVLRAVARLLSDNTRAGDLVARIGGEEFLVLFGATPLDMAVEVCERLRAAVQSHGWASLVGDTPVTISVGVCDVADATEVRAAIERADRALYAAKRGGRNQVQRATA